MIAPEPTQPESIPSETVQDSITQAETETQPIKHKTCEIELEAPTSWAQAMAQYHTVKPSIAAHLEHVICDSFTEYEVHLLLNTHQQQAIHDDARKHFASWLKRSVIWAEHQGQEGESLLAQQQREKDEYERKLWQQAEADPAVQLLKEKLGCRLVNVRPPEINIEADASTESFISNELNE